MAGYMDMPMLNELAQNEAKNVPHVTEGIAFWAAVVETLATSRGGLTNATDTLGQGWLDARFGPDFKVHVDAGLASMSQSEQAVVASGIQQALQDLATQMGTTAANVAKLYEEWKILYEQLKKLQAALASGQATAGIAAAIAAIIRQMETKVRLAEAELEKLNGKYASATGPAQTAGSGHQWNGPTGTGSPTLSSPAVLEGSTLPTDASSADIEALSSTDMSDLAAADGSQPVDVVPPVDADTGLAGGLATAPPMTTVPTGAVPPTTVPASSFTGSGAFAPFMPVAATAAAGRTSPHIQQAARVGGVTSASTGKAPSLPGVTQAVSGLAAGSRAPMPVLPLAGGAMAAGVPAMLGSNAAAGARMPGGAKASGDLQGLISRLKPVVTQPGNQDGDGGSNRRAGVPSTLRGRAARTDSEPEFAIAPKAGRLRRDDNAPETVQLLDEEIWQVDQAAGPVPTRVGEPGVNHTAG